jgi:hypothetical protein
VQVDERRALPALKHLKLDTCDRNHFSGPCMKGARRACGTF